MDEVAALKLRVQKLENIIKEVFLPDRIRLMQDLESNKDQGRKIGLTEKEKLGFWGTIPVVQFADPTGRGDTSGSSGTTMTTGHRFNGNTGLDYYSVGDIVYALKLCGILKNE